MEIAALIMATFSFGLSAWVLIRFEAKELSQHVIQYVPAESLLKTDEPSQALPVKRKRAYDPMADFDHPASVPLDEDERKYFEEASKASH